MAIANIGASMPDVERNWRFIKDNLTTLVTVITGLGSILLSRFHLISGDGLMVAALGILTLLATTELVDKTRRLDRIEHRIEREFGRISQSAGKVDVRHFTSSDTAFAFMTESILNAESCIDHAALASSVPRWSAAHTHYEDAISSVLRDSRVRYRYLPSLPEESREKRIRRQLSNSFVKRYFVRYLVLASSHGELQFHNFMVFDNKFVIINYPYSESEPERFLAIEHPEVVSFYSGLFAHLWSKAKSYELNVESRSLSEEKPTKVLEQ